MGCEKEGGPPRSQAQMDRFRTALEECELSDLGFAGDPYTWRNNSRDSTDYVRERLDRAVASTDWITQFPTYKVINGEPRHLDHRPIIVKTEGVPRGRSCATPHQFHFEAGWVEEKDCPVIVENAWRASVEFCGGGVQEVVRSVVQELEHLQKKANNTLNRIFAWLCEKIPVQQVPNLSPKICSLRKNKPAPRISAKGRHLPNLSPALLLPCSQPFF